MEAIIVLVAAAYVCYALPCTEVGYAATLCAHSLPYAAWTSPTPPAHPTVCSYASADADPAYKHALA
eukprot:3368012-Rhodomonas_salina.1